MCDKAQSNYSNEEVNFKFILRVFIGNPIMTSVEIILNIKDNIIVSFGSLMKMFVCLSIKLSNTVSLWNILIDLDTSRTFCYNTGKYNIFSPFSMASNTTNKIITR